VLTCLCSRHTSRRDHHVRGGLGRAAMAANQPRYNVHYGALVILGLPGAHHWHNDLRLLPLAEEEDPSKPLVQDPRLSILLLERRQLAGPSCLDMWLGTYHRRIDRVGPRRCESTRGVASVVLYGILDRSVMAYYDDVTGLTLITGFFISAIVFFLLNVACPVEHLDQIDSVDLYGTFTPAEARRAGVAPLHDVPSIERVAKRTACDKELSLHGEKEV
jgi:hypothetical protein